jgi:hypothetical protein
MSKERDQLLTEVREAFRLNAVAGDTMDQAASDFLGLHRTDVRLLDVLHMAGGMSAGELARAGHLSPARSPPRWTSGARRLRATRSRPRGPLARARRGHDRMQKLTQELYGPLAEVETGSSTATATTC